MRRKVIGITSYARDGQPIPSFTVPSGYVDAVRAAGGVPVVLPPGQPEPEQLLDSLDGLILSGGGDIGPQHYGGEMHETIYSVCEERDQFEMALLLAALARPDFPLLCICRGMQLLNVVCGGSLHAHLPEKFGEQVPHRKPPRLTAQHPVRIDPDSRLARLLGTTETSVCSWHHQALDRLGSGLRAVAWAADGVVEAIEHEARPRCIAIQWHPEMQLDDARQMKVFAALVT